MKLSPHLSLAKQYWKEHLIQGDVAIDATCGNGHDTLYLAQMGLLALFAIDVQPSAIEKTRALLEKSLTEEEFKKVFLFQKSHEDLRILPLLAAPSLIVYNLGYLPGGNKTITTTTESTLKSICSAFSILGKSGAISITCYPGHEEGEKEERALLDIVSSLSSSDWEICHHRWLNRPRSPSLIWIRRL